MGDRRLEKLFCTNCQSDIQITQEEIPEVCPKCNVKYFDKPINERKLHILQDQYLASRDESILAEMVILMEEIIKNLIHKNLKGSYVPDRENLVDDATNDSLLKILEYYKNKPEFYIENSFVGYLSQVILYPLYNTKKKEREHHEISLSSPVSSSADNNQTLEDKLSVEYHDESFTYEEDRIHNEDHKRDLRSSIEEFLGLIFKTILDRQGLRIAVINWSLLNHYLDNKEDRFFSSCWNRYDNSIKNNYDLSLYQLRQFIADPTASNKQKEVNNMMDSDTKNLWTDRLNMTFAERTPDESEMIINLVSMTIYSRNNKDLGDMYHALGMGGFSKIISLFSGRTLTFPDREEFQNQILIALCYYYKELKNMTWDEIKEELPFATEEVNTIRIGKGIAKLNKEIKNKLRDIFSEVNYG